MRKPQWCVRYKDIFGNDKVESFKEKTDADKCYESLLPRTYGGLGDIERVSPPVKAFVEEAVKPEMDWADFDDVVRRYLVGMEPNASGSVYYVEPLGMDYGACLFSKDSDIPLIVIECDFSSDHEGQVYVCNDSLDEETYKQAVDHINKCERDISTAMSGNYDYPVHIHSFKSRADFFKYMVDVDEDCGSSAASLGAVPTGGSRTDDESVVRTRKYGRNESLNLKALHKMQKFQDVSGGKEIPGTREYCVNANDHDTGCPLQMFSCYYDPDNEDGRSPEDVNKMADAIRERLASLPIAKKYSDYFDYEVHTSETDSFADGGIVMYLTPKESLWNEDLEDIEFAWFDVCKGLSKFSDTCHEQADKWAGLV